VPAGAPELSLVICTLNESAAIGGGLDEGRAELAGGRFEILGGDDPPDDPTKQAPLAPARGDPPREGISPRGPRGPAAPAIRSWGTAPGPGLGGVDGDGQHDPSLLPRMLGQMRGGADLAVASRFAPDASLGLKGVRRVISNVGTQVVRAVAGAATSDPLAGFFLQTRGVFQAARPKLTGVGFKILVDILLAGPRGLRVAEVATSLRVRQGGESKLDLRVMIELLAQLTERRTGGLLKARFLMFAGVGASGLAVHAAALALAGQAVSLTAAQGVAILSAMRDMRLSGGAFWRGLAAFVVACSFGAMVSETVAVALQALGVQWLAAGLAGAGVGALFNYIGASRVAWSLPALGGALRPAPLHREPAPIRLPHS